MKSVRRFCFVSLCVLCAAGSALGATGGDSQPLPADQAFKPHIERLDAHHLRLHIAIAPRTYLYRQSIAAVVADSHTGAVATIRIPKGRDHTDPFFGNVRIFRDSMDATVTLSGLARDDSTVVNVSYRGCADAGLCYPPQHVGLKVPATGSAAPESTATADHAASVPPSADAQSRSAALSNTIGADNYLITLAVFFGLGLLLAFSPCGLPMVPIVAGIVVGTGAGVARALVLTLCYVLAMACAYAVIGAIAGLAGANLQVLFQQPAIIGVFAAVFVILALASFGLFEMTLPSAWQQRLGQIGGRRNSITAAAIMGFTAALLVGPCLAPPLAGAFLYMAQSGNVGAGATALFALGLGMGTPLLAVAVFGAGVLPRSGPWMQSVRIAFGVLLLGIAWYLVSRFVGADRTLFGWGILALGAGAYSSAAGACGLGWATLSRALSFVLLAYAGMAFVGSSVGGGRPLQPLAGLSAPAQSTASSRSSAGRDRTFTRVTTPDELDHALARARRSHTPAVVDFYADWCIDCRRMARDVFSQPRIARALERIAAIQVDVTDTNAKTRQLLKRYDVFGPPTMVFFDARGRRLNGRRLIGYTTADRLLAHLHKVTPPASASNADQPANRAEKPG